MALGFTLVILVLLSTALECSGIVSDSLDAGIETQNVKAGKSLAMSCNIRGDVTEDLDCRWVAPDGQLYHVKNGNGNFFFQSQYKCLRASLLTFLTQ
jgi:hypothetical protein